MVWRRAKIAELRDPNLFKHEYPATAAEAFQMTGHDSFIPPALIAKARKHKAEPSGPLVRVTTRRGLAAIAARWPAVRDVACSTWKAAAVLI